MHVRDVLTRIQEATLPNGIHQLVSIYAGSVERQGTVLFNPYQYFLTHADQFTVDPGRPTMAPKQCFRNSILQCSAHSYDYVEGYVTINGFPIHHAWNTDTPGHGIDYTITDPSTKYEYQYWGVIFPGHIAMKVAVQQKAWAKGMGVLGTIPFLSQRLQRMVAQSLGVHV